jgi:hypothetical protein
LDTLGKTNADGTLDFSDLIKTESLEVSSENGCEVESEPAISANNLLAEIIEEHIGPNKVSSIIVTSCKNFSAQIQLLRVR